MVRPARGSILGVLVSMGLMCACSSEPEVSESFGDSLEEALNIPVEDLFEGEYIDAVNLCMEVNGFDNYQYDPDNGVILLGPSDDSPESAREYISENGSGLIYRMFLPEEDLLALKEEAEDGDLSPAQADQLAKEEYVLDQHADTYPKKGIAERGGCLHYAQLLLVADHPGTANRQSLSEAYAEFMAEEFFQSPEFLALVDEWVACMHQAGFSEVTEWNTEFDQILADGQELLSQGKTLEAPEVQALLERDRQTSLASSDCHEQIADRRLRLKNEKAAEFAGLRPTEVDELMSEVES